MSAPHHDRAAPFARVGLIVYTLLIVYASWYPFSGWQSNGLPPWAFLSAPLPHYWTGFDVVTNVLAYIPWGLLAVLALHPRWGGVPAFLGATLCGALLTGTMEAVQTFLPSRVSSNLDFICNLAGAGLGAAAGIALSETFLRESRLLAIRQRWFSPDAGGGLIVVALWPLAQIYPQEYVFGHGQVSAILSEWLSDLFAEPVDLTDLLLRGVQPSVDQYWLAETVISACGLAGAGLMLCAVLRRHAPRLGLAFALLLAALLVKSLASALQFAPENAFVWLTPGARGGLLLGMLLLGGLAYSPSWVQRRLATVSLGISLVLVNLLPANPYFVATLQTWVQGKFLNFNGAAQFLSLAWPFAAIWFLLHPASAQKRK